MKFGDVVTAVATSAVILVLFEFVFGIAFVAVLGAYWGMNIGFMVSVLLTGVVVGYIFARRIWEEARIEAIGKIAVLSAALIMFSVLMLAAALPDWGTWVKETYMTENPTATPSAFEWYGIEYTVLGLQVVINMVLVLVLGFIGLYIGSMLRKPKRI